MSALHFEWVGVPETDTGVAVFSMGGKKTPPVIFQSFAHVTAIAELIRDAEERGRQRGLAEVQALLERRHKPIERAEPCVPMPSPARWRG